MAMSQSTLATQLATLVPVANEAQAIVNLANAYAIFAADAESSGSGQILSTGVALGKAAMIAALPGVNSPSNGASIIANSVIAFWLAVATGLTLSFAGAFQVIPPANAGLLIGLNSQIAINLAQKSDLLTATNAIAQVMWSQAIIGGAVVVGVTSTPIL